MRKNITKLAAMLSLVALLASIMPIQVLAVSVEETAAESTETEQSNPGYQRVTPLPMNVVQMARGHLHTLVLDDEGNVWSYGNGTRGQLGTGVISSSTDDKYEIAQVELPEKAKMIICGPYSSAALLEDGSVYYWGNIYTSTTEFQKIVPTKIERIPTAKQIVFSLNVFHIVSEDGHLWSMGVNTYGDCALGYESAPVLEPTESPYFENIEVLHGNNNGCVAKLEDGRVFAWGISYYNSYLLNGVPPSSHHTQLVPTTDHNLPELKQLEFGHHSVYALTPADKLVVWGSNVYYQLGLGHNDNLWGQPTQGETDVKSVNSSNSATAILKNDGSVWTCGMNISGCLGTNAIDNSISTTFEQVDFFSDVKIVELVSGNNCYFARAENGDWYSWGYTIDPKVNYNASRSPILIFKATETEPQTNTVTVTETWADGSEEDATTTYQAETGRPLTIDFATPEGYTAEVESEASATVDYQAGTITLEDVAEDIAITITYTPLPPVDTHTVTVLVHYRDGAHPDEVTTYEVPEGGEFFEPYTVQPGYKPFGVMLYSFFYDVDTAAQTVYISEVNQDITVELQYEPILYNVTVTLRYEDGALEDDVQTYPVKHGEAFETGLEILDGYVLGNLQANVLGVGVLGDILTVRSVTGDVTVTVILRKQ